MCKLDCDEMYCDCCENNTSDLAKINLMFAKKRYEDAVKQVDEIKLLLIKAISTRRGLMREFLIALEEKQKRGGIMNNKRIARCLRCNGYYCMECSENDGWEDYCCSECEKDKEEYFEKTDREKN